MLFLTVISTEITDKGREKVRKVNSKLKEEDDYSPPKQGSAQWFKSMGLNPPKDIEEEQETVELDSEGNIELQEGEFEYVYDELILERSDFSSALDTKDGFSQVCTKQGIVYDVAEDTDVIFEQIYLLDQTWFEKICDEIKWRIKRIFKKEKDLIL